MGSNQSQPEPVELDTEKSKLLNERLHKAESGSQTDDENESATADAKPSFNPKEYSFPFENIVFEGGGVKGLAYCGAIRVMEETGMFKQIKRFAGASAGAMAASLLAVGYDSYKLEEFLGQDLEYLFLDARFGYLSFLPNLIKGYGWNPGNRIYEWFGNTLAKKTGNADITFKELYRSTGHELCIVVTNLNNMMEEFCHMKTTPDMPIRLAVRMSMAIPGLFQATCYRRFSEQKTYVDGGVLCNYPIHCFDGWWLSTEPGQGFLQKLQPLENLPTLLDKANRFGKYNHKTLGFLLFADTERELFKYSLENRTGVKASPLPDTQLARKKIKKLREQRAIKKEHKKDLMAVDEFLQSLRKNDVNEDGAITKDELLKAFEDEEFSEESKTVLFGENYNVDEVFEKLDADHDGEVECHELINFVQSTGVFLTQRYLGYESQEINGVVQFFQTLQNALLTNLKRLFLGDRDLDRTVGINTGHIDTADFKLEEADKKFAVEQGRIGIVAFLKYYVEREKLQKREDLETTS